MTRILHILDHSLPLQSGYTFRTRAILKAQQASGMDVRGITGLRHSAKGPNPEYADNLEFHRTPGQANGPAGWREWQEIRKLSAAIGEVIAQFQPNILHAHSPALCGMAALAAGRRHGIPVVYEIRAFWEDAAVGNGTGSDRSLRYRLTRALENNVVRRADAVVTICNGLQDDLIARGFPADRISIMPNGVDLSMFGKPLPRDQALADSLNIGDGPIIGFIGSFYDYEGIDDLIAAMPLLLERQPQARLLLVGGGPCADALAEQAARSPAASAIHFTGRVPHDQVERYYSLCDIMAYPRKASRLTNLVTPLKPLEAMAQGKIVAASNVGGHRELIRDGVTGSLFTADSPHDCAQALAELIAKREDWPNMRDAGRNNVTKNHDWATNVAQYRDVYNNVLAQEERNRQARAA
ncbi:TIGR04063 family PEP-CTERM/XrtA system glycosyltransferase [Altericroceibacterium endophyticum]|uniref:Glycosyltransferase, exosortase A system-associated n=1 Tax=Altericroceibacterium endophyticum TaxID=1808508 RepID=A0A6I4T7I3_9SPHN|nr:TIGR04063 family PEP-CTERM/XrtA system glycosyltransferase [Altericroceibacterium endophyticum]MXO65820.1 glycosyltransferase, exosortase A system-associated [Altericroceibacterium endophyticum]